MGNVVVDVMLKSEILDPQGQAVAGALPRLGFDQFTDVRQDSFELGMDLTNGCTIITAGGVAPKAAIVTEAAP